jgi:hypothetical protein
MVLTASQLAERRAAQAPIPSFDSPVDAVRNLFQPKPRTRVREVENPVDPKTWVFVHPDSTEGDPVRSKFVVELPDGQRVALKPDMGQYSTTDPAVCEALKAKGFRLVNDVPFVQNEPRWQAELDRLKEQEK